MGIEAAILAGSIGSSLINAYSTYKANQANTKAQLQINREQLDYAKNSNSIAAADRLKAGLSPLDSTASETPALGAPEVQAPQVADFGQTFSNAIAANQNQQTIDMQRDVSNAQVAKANAETQGILLQNKQVLDTMDLKVQELEEKVAGLKNENSAFKERLESELATAKAERDQFKAQYDRLLATTPVDVANTRAQTEAALQSANESRAREAKLKAETEAIKTENAALINDIANAYKIGMSPEQYKAELRSKFGLLDVQFRQHVVNTYTKFSTFVKDVSKNLDKAQAKALERKGSKERQRLYEMWQATITASDHQFDDDRYDDRY